MSPAEPCDKRRPLARCYCRALRGLRPPQHAEKP